MILETEHKLLGADQKARQKVVQDALINPMKDAKNKASANLEKYYEERRKILLESNASLDSNAELKPNGMLEPLKLDMRPCPNVSAVWPLGGWPRGPLPTYHLEVSPKVHNIYLTKAIGLMKKLESCYLVAEWKPGTVKITQGEDPWVHAIPLLAYQLSVGPDDVITKFGVSEDVELAFPKDQFAFDSRTNGNYYGADAWRARLANSVANLLDTSNDAYDAYLKLAGEKCDALPTCREPVWRSVAENYDGHIDMQLLDTLEGERKFADLAFAFGAPGSLRGRPQLSEVIDSRSVGRLPDRKLIQEAFDYLRRSPKYTAQGRYTAENLISSGVSGIFDARFKDFEWQVTDFANKDPLDQAEAAVPIALVRLRGLPKATNWWWPWGVILGAILAAVLGCGGLLLRAQPSTRRGSKSAFGERPKGILSSIARFMTNAARPEVERQPSESQHSNRG